MAGVYNGAADGTTKRTKESRGRGPDQTTMKGMKAVTLSGGDERRTVDRKTRE
jgi:hypothetical protein